MNITLLLNKDFLIGVDAVPKNLFETYYGSTILDALYHLNDNFFITLMFLSIIASIYLVLGSKKRIAMVICWLSLFFIFIRIPVARSIHIPFLGHMMLLYLFIPDPVKNKKFQIIYKDYIPKDVAICAWILIGGNYLFSALYKLGTTEWQTGQALIFIFKDIMPRQNAVKVFLNNQPLLCMFLSYFVLLVEGLGWSLFFKSSTRKLFLGLSALFHLGILIVFRMGELSSGLLVFHMFLFSTLSTLDAPHQIGMNQA